MSCSKQVYIQNKIEELPDLMYELLIVKKGYFFFCGPAGQVPIDIRNAIELCFCTAGGMTPQQATAKVDELIVNGHYVVEAWS
mmetsp:Transcript_24110/g.40409  ORF Transcript_24110/g.40409 Transcript_24110/m.40409 type:complete len:83 (-) Transcript_24110:482-730(-)